VPYQITHRTSYVYSSEVTVSQHIARLRPRTFPGQTCLAHELEILPAPSQTTTHKDYFGNTTHFFTIAGAHRELTVTSRSTVEVIARDWPQPGKTPAWETLIQPPDASLPLEAYEYIFPSVYIPHLTALADYARPSFIPGRPLLDAAADLMRRIFTEFTFDPTATTVATPLETVLQKRRGVCQDFAHLQIGCLRSLGLPARYVSGYLETAPPPGETKLVGADASHAWLQLYVPGFSWVDLDPTNNILSGARHITVAWGRDFDDVSPIRGVIGGGGKHSLSVAVDVTPLSEQPSDTAPQNSGMTQQQS
jgi:transglutaminase-like putative cysteine protease